ncbi:MAG TPA: hypothetical protein VFT87_04065, partial [Candidatus Saccharimonadales bacterium]|nr:hypothetical protein [Candidatus Saccharimonadales bacterium]
MIHIAAKTPNDAWRTAFTSLYNDGTATGNERYFRDEVVLIEIEDPIVEPADSRFPMKQEDLDIINKFIYTGENEDKVTHDWTKLYYHRAFDEPNSQIEFLIKPPRAPARGISASGIQTNRRLVCPASSNPWVWMYRRMISSFMPTVL